jgi:hypothetical protein
MGQQIAGAASGRGKTFHPTSESSQSTAVYITAKHLCSSSTGSDGFAAVRVPSTELHQQSLLSSLTVRHSSYLRTAVKERSLDTATSAYATQSDLGLRVLDSGAVDGTTSTANFTAHAWEMKPAVFGNESIELEKKKKGQSPPVHAGAHESDFRLGERRASTSTRAWRPRRAAVAPMSFSPVRAGFQSGVRSVEADRSSGCAPVLNTVNV